MLEERREMDDWREATQPERGFDIVALWTTVFFGPVRRVLGVVVVIANNNVWELRGAVYAKSCFYSMLHK